MEGILTNYRVEHSMKEPSKVSDYDYDPVHVNRRFISTYLHELKIYDRVMDTQLVTLGFASEVCADIIATLLNMSNFGSSRNSRVDHSEEYTRVSNKVVSTIKNVYVNNEIYPKGMVITKLNNCIKVSIANYEDPLDIILTPMDAEYLANLLDSDELSNMYAMDSNDINDRW